MKDQELYFRYDTLYITGDRYEFKKVKKRPLGIKLRRAHPINQGENSLIL